MRYKPQKILSDEFCKFGCGNFAKYEQKDGSLICSTSSNKCPINVRKNAAGLKTAHFEGRHPGGKCFGDARAWSRGKTCYSDSRIRSKFSKEDVFSRNDLSTGTLRDIIIKENIFEYICKMCGIFSWNDKNITLELDHVDGDRWNNTLENLRFLCPNCHSQTDTYKGKGINKGVKKISDEDFILALQTSKNIRQALIKLHLDPKGGNYERAYHLMSLPEYAN